MKRIYLLLIIAVLMGGCKKTYPKPYTQIDKKILTPQLGKINTAEIGQNMFSSTLSIGNKISVKDGYVQTRESDKKYIFTSNLLRQTKEGHIAICYSWFCSADTTSDGLLDSWWDARKEEREYLLLKSSKPYTIKTKDIQGSFKKDSLFQGKVGNKLKISFREFSNNRARPAFTQDIEYEYLEGQPTMVGFKGLRIEVLKATNLDITYKVLKDFD